MQHDAKSLGPLILARQLEAAARVGDRRLRAADALGDRRLGHQEGGGDLRGRQATDRPQSQRQLRRRRQRRMAAQEQQRQRVVLVGDLGAGSEAAWADGGLLARRPRRLGAKRVDQPPAWRPRSASRADSTGTPSTGHCCAAAISASCVASSARSKRPWRRATAARTWGASSRRSRSLTAPAQPHTPSSESRSHAALPV